MRLIFNRGYTTRSPSAPMLRIDATPCAARVLPDEAMRQDTESTLARYEVSLVTARDMVGATVSTSKKTRCSAEAVIKISPHTVNLAGCDVRVLDPSKKDLLLRLDKANPGALLSQDHPTVMLCQFRIAELNLEALSSAPGCSVASRSSSTGSNGSLRSSNSSGSGESGDENDEEAAPPPPLAARPPAPPLPAPSRSAPLQPQPPEPPQPPPLSQPEQQPQPAQPEQQPQQPQDTPCRNSATFLAGVRSSQCYTP